MVNVDFIVVGSGIAGLRAAIALASIGRALVLTKAEPTESNTGYAQGGIAVALGDDDNPELHAADTIRAGDGLCDEIAVRVLVEEGPRYVTELVEWGTAFDREADGRLARGREAAHSVRRVLHAGDATGREIARVLWKRVSALPQVETINHALVTELVVEDRAVVGVRFVDQQGCLREARAGAVLLATGGAGPVYRDTTNPPVATGDGVALGYHAGAEVADLEFVQFHPTALKLPGAPRFLISEALRGDGARLVNLRGEPFMAAYHRDADLAPRDVVARSIVREMERTGGSVFLTLAHLEATYVRQRFPTIDAMCRQLGLDLAHDPIPVGPAAHYMMGGVYTDEWGRTSLAGLFAAGEVACTGVHGANRLASNSLLEGLVFGARAASAMGSGFAVQSRHSGWVRAADRAQAAGRSGRQRASHVPVSEGAGAPAGEDATRQDAVTLRDTADVQRVMWQSVGLFRSRAGLERATAALDAAHAAAHGALQPPAPEPGGAPAHVNLAALQYLNLVTVARLIARAALRREESRGGHYREDFPERDDRNWRVHLLDAGSG